jgi:hypothetical protein
MPIYRNLRIATPSVGPNFSGMIPTELPGANSMTKADILASHGDYGSRGASSFAVGGENLSIPSGNTTTFPTTTRTPAVPISIKVAAGTGALVLQGLDGHWWTEDDLAVGDVISAAVQAIAGTSHGTEVTAVIAYY